MSKLHNIILRPLLTEKSTTQMEIGNKISFKVAREATKYQIRAAVEELFGVKVANVNTMVVPGKPKRFGRQFNRTTGYKKAIVTLAEGEVLDFFALEDEGGDGLIEGEDFGLEAFEDMD